MDGRWVLYGLLSGPKTQINLATLLAKRIQLLSSSLKTRSDDYKSELVADFIKRALSGFSEGRFRPVIYRTFTTDWTSPEVFIAAH